MAAPLFDPRHPEAGLTAVEMVIATILLALVSLFMALTFGQIQSSTNEVSVQLDMDEAGRKALNTIRDELRVTGWDTDGTAMLTSPTEGNTLSTPLIFRMRTGLGDTDWSGEVRYVRQVASDSPFKVQGNPVKYELVREEYNSGGTLVGSTTVATNLSACTFQWPAGDDAVRVSLTFLWPDPSYEGTGSENPTSITRTYEDWVQMQNTEPPE